MKRPIFIAEGDLQFPAVNEDEMREVDRIAVEDYQLGILPMMENAGRNLSQLATSFLNHQPGRICILAGSGGNGGGGLSCARHLINRGYDVYIFLTKPPASLRGAARIQMAILDSAGFIISELSQVDQVLSKAHLIIDALIGYSLSGPPIGETERLILSANTSPAPILSLDLPSGLNASNGSTPGVFIRAKYTLTLALPKIGLLEYPGRLYLGDIGIPPALYSQLGMQVPAFPSGNYILPLRQ